MNKPKAFTIMAVTEAVCLILVFCVAYFFADFGLTLSLIYALVLSFVSGISMYLYLSVAFGLHTHKEDRG